MDNKWNTHVKPPEGKSIQIQHGRREVSYAHQVLPDGCIDGMAVLIERGFAVDSYAKLKGARDGDVYTIQKVANNVVHLDSEGVSLKLHVSKCLLKWVPCKEKPTIHDSRINSRTCV